MKDLKQTSDSEQTSNSGAMPHPVHSPGALSAQDQVVCVVCDQASLQRKFNQYLADKFSITYTNSATSLESILDKQNVACILTYPMESNACHLWEFRKIKERFTLIPIIIICSCIQLELLGACAESFADDYLDIARIHLLPELVDCAVDRSGFLNKLPLLEREIGKGHARMKKALSLTHSGFTRIKYAEEVSKHLGISVTTFRKEFKHYADMPYTQYLIRLKLLYAAYLAQNNGFTGKAIALRCGFNDEHEFYRCFKKKTGITFTQYRSRYTFNDFNRIYKS